jgi:hypothetical protein
MAARGSIPARRRQPRVDDGPGGGARVLARVAVYLGQEPAEPARMAERARETSRVISGPGRTIRGGGN